MMNESAEKAILGAMLLDKMAVKKAINSLSENDFYFQKNAQIFSIMRKIDFNGLLIEPIKLIEELKKVYNISSDIVIYISELQDCVVSVRNIDNHIKIVRDLSEKRTAKAQLLNIAKMCEESEIDDIKKELNKIVIRQFGINVEGRRDLDERPYNPDRKINGVYIPTGLPTIDKAINDLEPQKTTIIFGRTNCGKSTLVNQIIANAVNRGAKVHLTNGEDEENDRINRFYRCVIGRESQYYKIVKRNKRDFIEPNILSLPALQKWHENKFVLFDKSESKIRSTEKLFQMLRREEEENNHNLLVLDNLMSLLDASQIEKNAKQGEFLENCKDLAKNYNCHVIIVMHTNKLYIKNTKPELETISGSADLQNKASNVIAVTRYDDEDHLNFGIDGHAYLLKNKYEDIVDIDLSFERETGLLLEKSNSSRTAYSFNWKKYLPKQEEML